MPVRAAALRFRALFPSQPDAQPPEPDSDAVSEREAGFARGQQDTCESAGGHETAPETTSEREADVMRLTADPEEAQWLARARQGDVTAFEWLMNRYRDRAIRLATHTLRRPAEAEDLVQEAFIRAFAQIRNFRGEAAFYSWLYTIVVRLCLNRMRHPRWHREWGTRGEESADMGAFAPDDAERHANKLQIEDLLDQLSPPLRAALVLRELEGMDYDEIAAALRIPVGTVRSRLNAARQQFRTMWERAMKEAADV